MRRLRLLCLAAGLSLALPFVVAPNGAQAQIDIEIGRPPPPPRVEVIPAPPRFHRERYAWDAGYWRWTGRGHVWVRGHYIRVVHPGAVRVPGHWDQTPNGRFHWVQPHWQ